MPTAFPAGYGFGAPSLPAPGRVAVFFLARIRLFLSYRLFIVHILNIFIFYFSHLARIFIFLARLLLVYQGTNRTFLCPPCV